MDRAEKIGLGAAVGGHGLLLLAMAFGLFMAKNRIVEPPSMAVTLVGEDSVSAAPDPVAEEPAAASAGEPHVMAEPEVVEPEVMEIADPEPQPLPKPVIKPLPKPATKPIIKPATKSVTKPVTKTVAKPVQKTAPKTPTKAATKTATQTQHSKQPATQGTKRGLAGLGDVVNSVSKTGKSATGTGTKSSTAATMTAAEVKSAVTVSLRAEIEPLFRRCAPSGVDVSDLLTLVTLKIGKDKRLTDVVFNSQSGVNESNRPQAPLHKKCAMDAARAASPYLNLPDEGYAQWASWQMKFKTR